MGAIIYKLSDIHERLDHTVEYVYDPTKTMLLGEKLVYVMDSSKTEELLYTAVLNCDSTESAYQEMLDVKAQFRKDGGVLGYHFVQSFSPDDNLTPEMVHEMGIRFAQEVWGDRYQVAIGTHLNKKHLHNHFAINSVSFLDGNKYRNKLRFLNEMRAINDKICQEYGLTIVVPKSKKGRKSYSDWKDYMNGITTPQDIIRADINECIKQSLTFEEFMARMQGKGYTFPRYGPAIKHMSLRPPGTNAEGKRHSPRRLDKLGDEYTEEAIRRRLAENTPEQVMAARQAIHAASHEADKSHTMPKIVRASRGNKKYSRKKLTGLQARYYRILYTLGMIRKRPQASTVSRALYFSMYDQVRQLDGYIRQMRLITSHNVQSLDDLFVLRTTLQEKIDTITKERSALYKLPERENHQPQIAQLTTQLMELRRALRDCESIEARSVDTEQRIRQVKENEAERQRKEQQEKLRGRSV